MHAGSIILQVRRQFLQNSVRTLLASGGILIGVWAIATTTSLSLSVSDTIVTAINSQEGATEISISKSKNKETEFRDLELDSTFTPLGLVEIENIVTEEKDLIYSYPQIDLNTYILPVESAASCYTRSQEIANLLRNNSLSTAEIATAQEEFRDTCPIQSISVKPLSETVKSNKDLWFGSSSNLQTGEVALCFECNSAAPLYKQLNVKNPVELLNKKIRLEFSEPPTLYKLEETIESSFIEREIERFKEPNIVEVTVKAVFDDREQENNFFQGQLNNTVYGTLDLIEQASKPVEEISIDEIGFQTYTLKTNSFENTGDVVKNLQNKGYLAGSSTLSLIQAIQYFFYGVSVVLGLFGLIALVASVFGIINVMTISVLRRKKQIGILKALGARGSDIFTIFILESSILGILGWLGGVFLTWVILTLTSLLFDNYVLTNTDWQSGLDNLNVTSFQPELNWYTIIGTLIVALLVTTVSGLIPSIKAARQNPVDVLR